MPICMVNAESLVQVPENLLQYLRALRRGIIELEPTDAQQRIADLAADGTAVETEGTAGAGPLSVIVALARLWVSESGAGRESSDP
jgi:hypothetical protein